MNELIESNLKNIGGVYGIKIKTIKMIIISPFLIVLLFLLLLIFPETRELGVAMLKENNLVEILTFLFLLSGGIKGFFLVGHFKKKKVLKRQEVIFYTIFSLSLLVVAMEEIAWGQWFLRFDTPIFWKIKNMQGETTIHNLRGIQGHTEILRLIFGLGGVTGVFLSIKTAFQKIKAPFILLPYFIIIITLASLDLYNDYYPTYHYIDCGINIMSEVVEALIGISSFLYVWLNERRIRITIEQK